MSPRPPEVFTGPLGEQLHRRLQDAIAQGQALGVAADDGDPLRALRGLIASLTERNGEHTSAREHELALERLAQRFGSRFEALARVQSAVAQLREATNPGSMLTRAPAMLCEASALTRAVLSVVRNGELVAEAVHVSGDSRAGAAVLERLRANSVRLEPGLIETELLRRRRASLVPDAQAHPRVHRGTAELMRWRSFVAAPVLVSSQPVAMIHADRGPGAALDVLDRDVLWEFASGLAQAYESAGLRRTLRREREQMRRFLEWIGAQSATLSDAPITLAAPAVAAVPPPEPLEGPAPAPGRDDRVVFAGLLTRRELDVLRLLAEGAGNRAVADTLVISEATVKFHVNSILRKLHVANRAEAVSRYLSLLGMRVP